MMLGPALAVAIAMLNLNLLGDAPRDCLDPCTHGQVAFSKR